MLAAQGTSTKLDKSALTISFERRFAAPREQVWDAWTKAEHIKHWWDPTGAPLRHCSVDLRPGGEFRFEHEDAAHGPPFAGVYRTLERPTKLVFEAMGALGTVLLESEGAATRMLVTIRCGSPAHFDQFVKLGVDVGTGRTLDNLVSYLKNVA